MLMFLFLDDLAAQVASCKSQIKQWQLFFKVAIPLFVLLLFLGGCKNELGRNDSAIDNPNGSLFDFSYDLEQVTFTKFGNGTLEENKALGVIDRVSATPKVLKQNFFTSVFADGTSEMFIKTLEPEHKFILNDSNPKDPDGDFRLIKNLRDGSCHVYNAKGVDVLASENIKWPKQDFSAVIKKIQENKNSVNGSDFEQFLNQNMPSFNSSLKEVEAQGGTFINLQGSIFQIDMPISNLGNSSTSGANFRDDKDFISQTIVDTTHKIILGGTLLNKDKSPVSRFFVKYTPPATKNDRPKAEIMHQEITDKRFVGNKKAVVISDQYYSNQSFKIH